MGEALPSIALLFDDAGLGSHLRDALAEHGGRIAYEGPLAGFDAGQLRAIDPDVLVVNLDDDDDEAFDRLYAMIGGERPRVVVNDAQASRALAGWDRARWARHLAVKVLAAGDIDPPRPPGALAPEIPDAPPAAPAPAEPADLAGQRPPDVLAANTPQPLPEAEPAPEFDEVEQLLATPADLEAELAALLAVEPSPAAVSAAPMPAAAHDAELVAGLDALLAPAPPVPSEPDPAASAGAESADVLSVSDDFDLQIDPAPPVAAPLAAPDWSLVEDVVPPTDGSGADAGIKIEKLRAEDFLAPDVEPVAPGIEPRLNLELVSLEEAVAPQAWEPHEMVLDSLGGVPRHVVLLGAAADGIEAVAQFLAGIPAGAALTLLLIQHFGAQPADAVLVQLAAHSALPVRFAADGARAKDGEVLLAPAGSIVQVRRDGSIELRATDAAIVPVPPIDAAFSMAANAFGRDALGIVFAGASTDAVAGAQAIHDRGGQVWVEATGGERSDDMVGAIFAEHLVSHSGTPQELAAYLVEVYA